MTRKKRDNPEDILARKLYGQFHALTYKHPDKERSLEIRRQWKRKNRDKVREYEDEWRERNREQYLEAKRRYNKKTNERNNRLHREKYAKMKEESPHLVVDLKLKERYGQLYNIAKARYYLTKEIRNEKTKY